MHVYDIAVITGICVVISSIMSLFWRWLWDNRRSRRIKALENAQEILEDKFHSLKMVERRQATKEETNEGMQALAEIWSSKEGTKEEKIQASLPLVLANPALMKQGMKLIGKL